MRRRPGAAGSLATVVAAVLGAAVLGAAVLGAAVLGAGGVASARPVPVATPLRAAPEPAVSPTARPHLPGTIVPIGGHPEGIEIDGAGLMAVSVRRPDGVELVPVAHPGQRHLVGLGGTARHLGLVGPGGPLLVPDESDDTLVEMALPSGQVLARLGVGRQPHDAIGVGPSTVFVADELANTVHVVRGGRVVRVVRAPLQPGGMAADPTGRLAVVVGVRGRRIVEYTAGGTVVGAANCGAGPTHAVTGDGGSIWVTDTNGGAVLGFELTASGPRQVATIAVGPRPYGIAFDTGRDILWVTVTGTDHLVGLHLDGTRVARRTVLDTVRQPNTVAVDPATGEVVVAGATVAGPLQLIPGAYAK